MERLKTKEYKRIFANNYFWRTYDRQEIDLVEEREGKLFGYEFKYHEKLKCLKLGWKPILNRNLRLFRKRTFWSS